VTIPVVLIAVILGIFFFFRRRGKGRELRDDKPVGGEVRISELAKPVGGEEVRRAELGDHRYQDKGAGELGTDRPVAELDSGSGVGNHNAVR
jgi:hypothetical protein